MVSQTTEHALRALLYLAGRADESPIPAEAIARAIDAPKNYLSKTLHALTKTGLVSGTRGPHGGFRLEADATAITLAQVIGAFDSTEPRQVCLLGGRPCHDRRPCRAHRLWKSVWAESVAPLERTTLADLLDGPRARETAQQDVPERPLAATAAPTR